MPSEFRRRLGPTRVAVVATLCALTLGGAAFAQAPGQGQPNPNDASTFRAIGKTRSCINMQDVGNMIASGERSLLFSTVGNVWFRSDLKDSCPLLKEDQIPNSAKGIYLHNSDPDKYCATDRFTVIDNQTIVWLGQCTLGEFTPVAIP